MKQTYNKLTKEFNRKVKELQKTCQHKRTKWAQEAWAVGHYTGNEVRFCLTCHKVLEKVSL